MSASESSHGVWAVALVLVAFLALIGFLGVSCATSCNATTGYESVTTYPDGRVEAKCR